MSPLVFNLVIDHVFRLVYGKARPRGASYGDDIVLTAATEANARAEFARFKKVAEGLGFKNVRALEGTDLKRSRIYNTKVTPVPLIKTFLVSPTAIRLTGEHDAKVRRVARRAGSLSALRRACTYRTVSKSYLTEVLGLPSKTSRHLGPSGFEQVGEPVDTGPRDLGLPVGDEEDFVSSSSLGENEFVSSSSDRENEAVSLSPSRGVVPVDGSDGRGAEGPPLPEYTNGLPTTADLGLSHLYYTATTPSSGTGIETKRKGSRGTAPARRHRNGCPSGGGTGPCTASRRPAHSACTSRASPFVCAKVTGLHPGYVGFRLFTMGGHLSRVFRLHDGRYSVALFDLDAEETVAVSRKTEARAVPEAKKLANLRTPAGAGTPRDYAGLAETRKRVRPRSTRGRTRRRRALAPPQLRDPDLSRGPPRRGLDRRPGDSPDRRHPGGSLGYASSESRSRTGKRTGRPPRSRLPESRCRGQIEMDEAVGRFDPRPDPGDLRPDGCPRPNREEPPRGDPRVELSPGSPLRPEPPRGHP